MLNRIILSYETCALPTEPSSLELVEERVPDV